MGPFALEGFKIIKPGENTNGLCPGCLARFDSDPRVSHVNTLLGCDSQPFKTLDQGIGGGFPPGGIIS